FRSLNSQYHLEVLASWAKDRCMPEIRRRLGYRFRLIDSSAQAECSQLRVSVAVQNDGFADLYNSRSVFLILRHLATVATQLVRVSSDPRWLPSESTTVHVTATLERGEYDILLHFARRCSLSERSARVRCSLSESWGMGSGRHEPPSTDGDYEEVSHGVPVF